MKHQPFRAPLILLAILFAKNCPGGIRAETVEIIDRGPHHQLIETVSSELTPAGETIWITNRHVRLETGLHRKDREGNWQETDPRFELVDGQMVAHNMAFTVSLLSNPNTDGAVQVWLLKGFPTSKGKPEDWRAILQNNPSGQIRARLRAAQIRAARVIDRLCRYRGVKSFEELTRLSRDLPAGDVKQHFDP